MPGSGLPGENKNKTRAVPNRLANGLVFSRPPSLREMLEKKPVIYYKGCMSLYTDVKYKKFLSANLVLIVMRVFSERNLLAYRVIVCVIVL